MNRESVVLGTLFGLASALGYTAANICLRSVARCDPIWVSWVKALPTVVLLGVWLLMEQAAGKRTMPRGRFLWTLLLSALFMHIGGNVPFQWSLGVLGIALSASLMLGSIIVSGAILGRVFLNEPISFRAAAAIVVVGIAAFVLALGADEASAAVLPNTAAQPVSVWQIVAGVAAACFAGFAYGQLGVVMRHGLVRGAAIVSMLWTVSTVGAVSLGLLSLFHVGVEAIGNTRWADLKFMIGAGVFTTVAFLVLAKALQLTSVNYINTLNASQAAMCAVAGVWFFSEPPTAAMWTGVGLTAVGLMMMDRRRQKTPQLAHAETPLAARSPSP